MLRLWVCVGALFAFGSFYSPFSLLILSCLIQYGVFLLVCPCLFLTFAKKSACFSSPDFVIVFARGIKSPMKFLLRNVFIIGHRDMMSLCNENMQYFQYCNNKKKGKLFIAIFQTKEKKGKTRKLSFIYINWCLCRRRNCVMIRKKNISIFVRSTN